VHMAMIPAAQHLCECVARYAVMSRPAQFLVFLLPYAMLSTLTAAGLHYGVERPFLLMRDRRAATSLTRTDDERKRSLARAHFSFPDGRGSRPNQ
jgi:hypothetical protein